MDTISVRLTPEAVAGLREGRSLDGGETQKLLKAVHEMGIKFMPTSNVASTPDEASAYFVPDVNPADAANIVKTLNACKAVENAHRVPSAELP